MGEEQSSLHIDTDWKKQAQEEKRRLAEQTAKAPATPAVPPLGAAPPPPADRASARGRRPTRELPPATFATLVQSIVTQVLFYLGDLAAQGGEPVLNLDMAKHQIDLLGMLEEKTQKNLADDEMRFLDAALYETRSRYISVASQFIGP